MARNRIYIKTVGLEEMIDDFERAAIPGKPASSVKKLNLLADAAFAATQSKVHVETGRLRISGRVDKHYISDVWYAEIKYRRNPGIFELARGDSPTKFHPNGGHHFFNAVEPFIPHMAAAVNDVFDDYFGGKK